MGLLMLYKMMREGRVYLYETFSFTARHTYTKLLRYLRLVKTPGKRKQIKFLWSFQRDVYGYGVYLTITHFLNEPNRVSREHFFRIVLYYVA